MSIVGELGMGLGAVTAIAVAGTVTKATENLAKKPAKKTPPRKPVKSSARQNHMKKFRF